MHFIYLVEEPDLFSITNMVADAEHVIGLCNAVKKSKTPADPVIYFLKNLGGWSLVEVLAAVVS